MGSGKTAADELAALRAEVARLREIAEERDRTACALKESQERLAQLVQQSPIAVIEWNTEFRVVEWNDAAERIFGYTRAEMLGQHANRIIPEVVRPQVDKIWAELLGQQGGTRSHNENVTRDGRTIVCEWYNGPRADSSGAVVGVISLAQDVTEMLKAERERKRLEESMLEAAKLESLGVLAGGIAHDFNNLLVGISGATSLALYELSEERPALASVRGHLELVESSANRAADLTRQILAYSGRGRFVVEVLDLQDLLREMIGLLKASIAKNTTLSMSFPLGGAVVEADATQLRQVVMNLLLNASQAVGESEAEITLSAGVVHCTRSFLASTWLHDELPEGEYAYLEVADNGPGMDAATRARVFEPFFTTKRTGSGLGLAAVQGIVRSHQGFIELESRPGWGTRFRIGLPHCERPVGEPRAEAPRNPWKDRGGRVLVVDDEREVRTVVRGSLERKGFQVLEAGDGKGALDLIATDPSAVRAVLLDLTMPGLSGDEVFRRLRELEPDMPVILMSGYDEGDVIRRFGGNGPAGFLQKPFRPSQVLELLRRVLEPDQRTGGHRS